MSWHIHASNTHHSQFEMRVPIHSSKRSLHSQTFSCFYFSAHESQFHLIIVAIAYIHGLSAQRFLQNSAEMKVPGFRLNCVRSRQYDSR